MLILGLETATPVCSAALVECERVVAQYTLELGVHHSERLMPMVQRVLADFGAQTGDLDGVAVSAGPGSFTGLRIGMGMAKGLCMAMDVSLLCIPTLAGMALGAGCSDLPICPMLDARRDEVYAGVYDLVGGRPLSRVADRADGVTNWLRDMPRPVVFVGGGAWVYREPIVDALGMDAHFVSRALGRPEAGAIALLGHDRLARGEHDDVDLAEPMYLRRSYAERAREARLKMQANG